MQEAIEVLQGESAGVQHADFWANRRASSLPTSSTRANLDAQYVAILDHNKSNSFDEVMKETKQKKIK